MQGTFSTAQNNVSYHVEPMGVERLMFQRFFTLTYKAEILSKIVIKAFL